RAGLALTGRECHSKRCRHTTCDVTLAAVAADTLERSGVPSRRWMRASDRVWWGTTEVRRRQGGPMILGTVRRRLGRHDAQLAVRLLAAGRSDEHARLERLLADGG